MSPGSRLQCLALAVWLVLAIAQAAVGAQGQPARILIVYENESTLPAAMEVARGIRLGLDERLPRRFEIYSEYLDTVRFSDADRVRRLGDDLAEKYRDTHLDLAMAVGPGAMRFLLDNRGRLASGVPLVMGGVSEEGAIKDATLPADAKAVVSRFDVRKTIDLARQLQPDARRIVVMTGSAPFDREWAKSAHEALDGYNTDLQVDYVSDLTLDGFKAYAQRLPRDAILLILTIFQDADGRTFSPREPVTQIAPASGAPAYGVYSTFIGAGVLGGHVETFESIGREMVALTDQFIAGGQPTPQLVRSQGAPLVDWRQLMRWNIAAERLPPGAELRFHEPDAWERYSLQILAGLAVIALLALTIAALVVQHRRSRRVEQELALGRLELAHMARATQMGELSGAFAHELNQPLTSILANAQAGARLLDTDQPDIQELKEILSDIVEEDKRASGVIMQLRQMLVKGDVTLDPVNLNEAVTSTIRLARSELVSRQTKLEFIRGEPELPVRANVVQLQQVILNLVLNAAEAMSQVTPAERHIAIETRKREDEYRELSITDRGPGLSAEMQAKAFQPFMSTKPKGLGLGLAICRSIAVAHGGTLRFDEDRTDGARIVLALPPLPSGS